LGDHNFASTNGPSFGTHQELIAGQEGHASEVPSKMPWGCDAPKEDVTWVMPHGGASDHAGGGSGACGPAWVTQVVNAIGQSQYWKSTAIIVTWDEWGGWFDHMLPQQYPNSETKAYEGLGYRVPLIVISPYAKTHYVSKSRHETASALHFIEKIFGLPFVGKGSQHIYDDQRADAYDDVFQFSQKPTTFRPIPAPPNYQTCLAAQQSAPAEMDY
ncbi:MAG: alkaline phosphatase family protein, partial [Candidatus Tumulicola sp.]